MGLSKAADSTPHDETDPGRPGIPMDGYDRYLLPDPTGEREGAVPWTRSSTVKGRIQNSEALKAYNEKMLAKGLAISPDLEALIAATPLSAPGAHDTLMEAIEQAKVRGGARVAANLGSALHGFTESLDKGEPLEDVLERVPDRLKPDVQAYADMLVRNNLVAVPELVERVVVNRKLKTGLTWDGKEGTRSNRAAGAAARFDRMYRWTDPEGNEHLISGDLKTGKNAVQYGSLETCCQIATAVNADAMWNEDRDEYEPMPDVRRDIGLLIHLPVGTGRCEPEELDLVLGWEAAQLAVKLMLLDKAKDACHRPFNATLMPEPMQPAPEPEEAPSGRLPLGSPETATALAETKQRAATERATERPIPDESRSTDEPQAFLDELLEAEPLDVAAVEAAARREAEARELAPLARDVGASRGCSQCGRTGHRSNSRKCLGIRDPEVRARKAIGIVELRNGPMTGRPSAGGPIAYTPPEEPATVPVPDGVIACGPDGAVTELTPEDAATVQAFADQLQAMSEQPVQDDASHAPEDGISQGATYAIKRSTPSPGPSETCSHSGGYTLDTETGIWVCAKCGQESPQAAEARQVREAMADRTQEDAERMAMDVAEPAEEPAPEVCPGDPTHYARAHEPGGAWFGVPLDHEPDPFQEQPKTWEQRVQAAESRQELSELRKEALAKGEWTKELTALGLARLKDLPN